MVFDTAPAGVSSEDSVAGIAITTSVGVALGVAMTTIVGVALGVAVYAGIPA